MKMGVTGEYGRGRTCTSPHSSIKRCRCINKLPEYKGTLGSLIFFILITASFANLPPHFTDDMNNHVIPENTPVGTVVYTLKAVDPEKSPLKYGIMGTDRLKVDERTGVVTVAKLIDREASDRLKISVTVEDVVKGNENNVVTIPVSVTVSDVNDNAPIFLNQSLYENLEIGEETSVGSKILGVELRDPDLTGMALAINCTPASQSPEACDVFHLEVKETTAGYLKGELRLAKKLNFNRRSLYQFQLIATDGEHRSKVELLIRVRDVQNTAPIFTGAMAGRVMEDAPVGTLVMLIQANDGDLGRPRDVRVHLLSNPGEVFQLDPKSGRLSTTRPLDREQLGSLLSLQVRATELPFPDEKLRETDVTSTTKNITILIDDINDSEPTFNKKEYFTEIHENTMIGSPLPDLDMVISDADTGTFADFTLKIDGPLEEYFDIQPKFATGSVRPVIRIKKSFDHENPNERKFIILVIAQNTDEPELFSTATVTLTTIDENDNRPKFDREVYQITIPELTKPGTMIGQITAEDPDSNEFGDEGLIYQLIGTGSKLFKVNNRTGEISVAECETSSGLQCLDYETHKIYDLLYMASDTNKGQGFLKSVVPLQIILTDSNDNPVEFKESLFRRTIPENTAQFEPRFFVQAEDVDDSSVISYQIFALQNSSIHQYFKIDENTAEVVIRNGLLPPANYSFKIEANDGIHTAITTVFIQVTDINNHYPAFTQKTLENRNIMLPEDAKVGSVIATIKATDNDLRDNGLIRYSIDKGAYGFFEIDPITGDITLIKEVDNDETPEFELLISAHDQGTPPMRTTTTLQINVGDIYQKLPRMYPSIQRVQVSESSEIGDFVTQIQTNAAEIGLSSEDLDLQFDFVDPIEARNSDNQQIKGTAVEMAREWFRVDNTGKVSVSSVLQRELVTAINFTVMITSEKSRPGSKHLGSLMVTIFEVNDKPPIVEDMEIEILEELPPGQAILTLEAEDPEGGQISHYFIEQGSEFFSVDNRTGEVKVAGRLDYEHQPMYNITVVAIDSGVPQLSSTATIMVSLLNDNDNDPKFKEMEYEAEVEEHPQEGKIVTQISATDLDVDSTISYEILPTKYSQAFTINRLGEIIVSKEGPQIIDREQLDENAHITLNVRASDGERVGYTTVRIKVLDLNDNGPKFEQKKYQITVHAPLRAKQEVIRVSAHGGDLPETDQMHYTILDGNDDGIFEVDQETGIVRAAQAYEKAGEVNLIVGVDDVGGVASDSDLHSDRTSLFVQILPGNFRKPEFLFPNKMNSTLIALESDLEEKETFANSDFTKVLGQILAFDADDGEAGKIQFYFKEGDNLVTETERFRIESDTGKIHQIMPLDREEMNKYDLVIVAKDGGIPVSTQSQHVLTIQIKDIDDHKPYFKERHYHFTIKENSVENTFIGKIQAEDEDEGKNAEIFYFLVTKPEDQQLKEDWRMNIRSGIIHSARVLDRERVEHYHLFVRASSSPIINKSMESINEEDFKDDFSLASINITVLDENDNSPRFPEKQYYAAINSDAEPGREIMTLESIDVDSELTSPVQYSLLGANLLLEDFKSGGSVVPSPFKVDPHSGRLTLSQSAMRQYAGGNNRFQVKVGVRETVPPYNSDTTHVQVWVVESSQETVLTVKSPPKSLIKEGLIDTLTNITGSYVLITKIVPHVLDDLSVNKEWSDVYVTAIDKNSQQTVPVSQFLQTLDLNHDQLQNADMPIVLHAAVPAVASVDGEGEYYFNGGDSFDAAFAGLVALVALLCMGLAAIIACCCCINRMYDKDTDSEKQTIYGPMKYPLHASHPSIPGTPNMNLTRPNHNSSDMIEDTATDNPLWIDHKIKTYEEQELTMQVASEWDNSNGSVELDAEEEEDEEEEVQMTSSQFNAYATLHPHHQDYDQINILGEDTVAIHL